MEEEIASLLRPEHIVEAASQWNATREAVLLDEVTNKDGQITLFDFDDCAYNWFINDIAVAMPMYSDLFTEVGWEAKLTEFFQRYMQGYQEENHLDELWLEYLPDSLRLQNIITLIACYQSNVPDSQYRSFYELVLKICQQGHPLFAFGFRNAYESLGDL